MISPNARVLIAGDSWGCGEWDNNTVTHKGLEHFLVEYGCIVRNVSRGGRSNHDSYLQIDKLKHANYDVVIWFQTDPIRDLRPYNNFPKSITELNDVKQRLLKQTYEYLNALEIPIYCIGGTTKLDESITQYEHLFPMIDSVIEFLGGKSVDIWISEWIQLDSIHSHEFIDELYNLPKPDLPHDFFYPDGYHPNRHGHKKIFEHLIT